MTVSPDLAPTGLGPTPLADAPTVPAQGSALPALSPIGVDVQNTSDRVNLLSAAGHDWMDPQTTAATVTAPTSNADMLKTAATMRDALSTQHNVEWFFTDPVLEKQPSLALGLKRYINGTVGDWPIGNDGVTSVQRTLKSQGFAADLPDDGVWDEHWQAAMSLAEQKYQGEQFQGERPGSMTAEHAAHGFLEAILPSHLLHNVVSFIESVPGSVRSLLADLAAGGTELITLGQGHGGDVGAGIENFMRSGQKVTAAEYVESTKHPARYLDHLGTILMLVPVFGTAGAVARAAGENFLADGFKASLSLAEAARGPGAVAKTLLGGRDASVLERTAGAGVRPALGAGGGRAALGRVPLTTEQQAARAAITDGRAQGVVPRVFQNIPALRQVGPVLAQLADADGWYYRMRTTLAQPYRVPAVKAAGMALGRGQAVGAGLEAVDYAERHTGGAGMVGSNVAQQQAGHNVLDTVTDAAKRFGPLTDLDNLALILHGPWAAGERVSDSIGRDVDALKERIGGAAATSMAIPQAEYATGETWHRILNGRFAGKEEDAHQWLSDELKKAAAYFHAEKVIGDPEQMRDIIAHKDELLAEPVDKQLFQHGRTLTPETTERGNGELTPDEKVRVIQALASSVYKDPAKHDGLVRDMLAQHDNYFTTYLKREITYSGMQSKAWMKHAMTDKVAAGHKLTAVLDEHGNALLSPETLAKTAEAERRINAEMDAADKVVMHPRGSEDEIADAGDDGWTRGSNTEWDDAGPGYAPGTKLPRRARLHDEYHAWREAEVARREQVTKGYATENKLYSDARQNTDAVKMPTFKEWLKGNAGEEQAYRDERATATPQVPDATVGGAPLKEPRPAWLAKELAKEEVGIIPPGVGAIGIQRLDNWTVQDSAHARADLQARFDNATDVATRSAVRQEAVRTLADEFGQNAKEMLGLNDMPALMGKWAKLEKTLPTRVYGATDEAQAALDAIEIEHGYRVVHGVDVGHMYEPTFQKVDRELLGEARSIRRRVAEHLGLNTANFGNYTTAVDARLTIMSEMNKLFARDPETGERLVKQFGEPPPGVNAHVLMSMIADKIQSGEIRAPRWERGLKNALGRETKGAKLLAERQTTPLPAVIDKLRAEEKAAADADREKLAGQTLRTERAKAARDLMDRDGIDRKTAEARLDAHPDQGSVQTSLDGKTDTMVLPTLADIHERLNKADAAARAKAVAKVVKDSGGKHTPESAGKFLDDRAELELRERALQWKRENDMTVEEARKTLAEQAGQGWSYRDLSRKDITSIWTDPKLAPSYVHDGAADVGVKALGVLSAKQADLAYRALIRGYTKRPTYMVGAEVLNDFMRGGLIRLAGNVGASDRGLVTHVLAFPDSIARTRDRLRFRLSPRYAIGELLEANARMAQEHIPMTMHPGGALMRMGDNGRVHKEAFELIDRIRPMENNAFLDDTLRTLYQQDVYGIWNLREGEAYAAWHLANQGYSDHQIEQKITKIFHYGTTTTEGRSALERTGNTLFFPWSYQKVFMRNTVGYLLDHPGQSMMLSAGIAQYQQALATPGIHDWVKQHLPLMEEVLKLNPFAMGISPGEVGGINRPVLNMLAAGTQTIAPAHSLPLLNLFLPQQWNSTQNNSSMALRLVPLVRDLGQFLSSVKDQGQIGYHAAMNFMADTSNSTMFTNVRPVAESSKVQFTHALQMRAKLKDALADIIGYNSSAAAPDKVLWPANFDKSVAGLPINATTISALVHAHYPTFNQLGGEQAASQRALAAANFLQNLPPDKREKYQVFSNLAEALNNKFDNKGTPANPGPTVEQVAAAQEAIRKTAIKFSETDPQFLHYYTAVTHYDNIFGPITRTY